MLLCCQKRLFIGQWITQPLQWWSIFVFKSFQQYPLAPSKQSNPVPNNTGVALNYQISLFLLSFGWHVYGESFNPLTFPGLTGALWACREHIAAPEGSPSPDKWLQTDLGGWNKIRCLVAALTSEMWRVKPQTGLLPLISAEHHPMYFPASRRTSVQGWTLIPVTPWSGSHLASLVESLLVLSNEIQRETLSVFSWVGTSSWPMSAAPAACTENGFGGCGGVYFLQNAHLVGDFLGILFLTTSFGACCMQRIRIWP